MKACSIIRVVDLPKIEAAHNTGGKSKTLLLSIPSPKPKVSYEECTAVIPF